MMTLEKANLVSVRDIESYAWGGLRRFHNQEFVADKLLLRHRLSNPKKSHLNKQARQIRYCLMQAREYADAARSVSLATKPVLAYYSIMSLALAEILLKQTGEASLDRARSHHRHHGLVFNRMNVDVEKCDLADAAANLTATPMIGGEGRFGTFELWHRGAREMPICTTVEDRSQFGYATTSFQPALTAQDVRLQSIPAAGISLLDALLHLPGMYEYLPRFSVEARILRSALNVVISGRVPDTITNHEIILHPSSDRLRDEFISEIRLKAEAVNIIDYLEMPGGGIIRWGNSAVKNLTNCEFPHGSMWTQKQVRFWPKPQPLNEFGFFYVALFIAGNYARYFPDKWIAAVETSAPIALVTEELLGLASWRVPLLGLSELTGVYQVLE